MDDIDPLQLLPDALEATTGDAEVSDDATGTPASRGTPARVEQFIGIVRSGPKTGGGPDYTDARYYIDRAAPKYGSKSTDAITAKSEAIPGLDQCVTATNLAELADGAHALPVGTTVHVFATDVRGRVGTKTYFFDQSAANLVIVKITGSGTGAGEYDGQILHGSSNATPESDLAMPAGMTLPASSDALVLNVEESGITGNRLAAGSYAVGSVRGHTSETPPRSIVVVRGGTGRTDGATTLAGGGVTPSGASWSRTSNATPLALTVVTAFAWDSTHSLLLANTRTLTFDARGLLVSASSEGQYTVAAATACP